jgi:hypothetical protein
VEKVIQEYHNLADQLGLTPVNAPHSGGKDLMIDLHPQAARIEHMTSVDLRNVVKVIH